MANYELTPEFLALLVEHMEQMKNRRAPSWDDLPKKTGIVYLITNECGLYYIGKHIVPGHLDPWITQDSYYGSGKNLKKALNIIKTGWNPRETIWVGKTTSQWPGRDAYKEETRLINMAKGDQNCLNHYWDIMRWVQI